MPFTNEDKDLIAICAIFCVAKYYNYPEKEQL